MQYLLNLKSLIKRLNVRFGGKKLLFLPFYPLTLLITTPVRLVQSLWACRVLAHDHRADYLNFTPATGITSLFYWTVAINFSRFGRSGMSPYLGLGDYRLGRFFQYTWLSLYSYWKASNITLLLGMFGWFFMHFIWLNTADPTWIILIMALVLFSTTFYANTFALQNYNVLGWALFPLGIYGIIQGNWILAGCIWLFISFTSFTIVVIVAYFCLVQSLFLTSIFPFLTIIPALIKLLTNFSPVFKSNASQHDENFNPLVNILKALGVIEKNVKYKRTDKKINLRHSYFILLYLQYILMLYYLEGTLDPLLISGIILYIINARFLRFADYQTLLMTMLSLLTLTTINVHNYFLLPSFWLVISPLPPFSPAPWKTDSLLTIPSAKPFNIRKLIDGVSAFLAPVQENQRVLMCYTDPHDDYNHIFDGYRILNELPSHVANLKRFHFMPDWWAVFDTNYEGAPNFWGREPEQVKAKLQEWKADYAIIYQHKNEKKLDPVWENSGFTVLNNFFWSDFSAELGDSFPQPNWWLLERNPN